MARSAKSARAVLPDPARAWHGGGPRHSTARLLAVGATDQEADDVARAGAAWTVSSYSNPSKRAEPARGPSLVADPVERYMNDVVIRGAPDRVLDKIVELRETIGLEYLSCARRSATRASRCSRSACCPSFCEVLARMIRGANHARGGRRRRGGRGDGVLRPPPTLYRSPVTRRSHSGPLCRSRAGREGSPDPSPAPPRRPPGHLMCFANHTRQANCGTLCYERWPGRSSPPCLPVSPPTARPLAHPLWGGRAGSKGRVVEEQGAPALV